ncbi:hypothetical protein ADUPG1_009590 [Aduncisulcus paluster]|uniref:Uncharacterized protein n=1 Tax=Aduncisulcus paluster TaxID=2918883 RepID=A0ABQ5KYD6_9EUKA|nr:hypothetical protein ADUPG1_009590 [Aduncisulcus paluster]
MVSKYHYFPSHFSGIASKGTPIIDETIHSEAQSHFKPSSPFLSNQQTQSSSVRSDYKSPHLNASMGRESLELSFPIITPKLSSSSFLELRCEEFSQALDYYKLIESKEKQYLINSLVLLCHIRSWRNVESMKKFQSDAHEHYLHKSRQIAKKYEIMQKEALKRKKTASSVLDEVVRITSSSGKVVRHIPSGVRIVTTPQEEREKEDIISKDLDHLPKTKIRRGKRSLKNIDKPTHGQIRKSRQVSIDAKDIDSKYLSLRADKNAGEVRSSYADSEAEDEGIIEESEEEKQLSKSTKDEDNEKPSSVVIGKRRRASVPLRLKIGENSEGDDEGEEEQSSLGEDISDESESSESSDELSSDVSASLEENEESSISPSSTKPKDIDGKYTAKERAFLDSLPDFHHLACFDHPHPSIPEIEAFIMKHGLDEAQILSLPPEIRANPPLYFISTLHNPKRPIPRIGIEPYYYVASFVQNGFIRDRALVDHLSKVTKRGFTKIRQWIQNRVGKGFSAEHMSIMLVFDKRGTIAFEKERREKTGEYWGGSKVPPDELKQREREILKRREQRKLKLRLSKEAERTKGGRGKGKKKTK